MNAVDPSNYLNLRWSLADVAQIARLASTGVSVESIAIRFNVSTEEMKAMLKRNAIHIRKRA